MFKRFIYRLIGAIIGFIIFFLAFFYMVAGIRSIPRFFDFQGEYAYLIIFLSVLCGLVGLIIGGVIGLILEKIINKNNLS